MNQGF